MHQRWMRVNREHPLPTRAIFQERVSITLPEPKPTLIGVHESQQSRSLRATQLDLAQNSVLNLSLVFTNNEEPKLIAQFGGVKLAAVNR
jgi:hypothetical protein